MNDLRILKQGSLKGEGGGGGVKPASLTFKKKIY